MGKKKAKDAMGGLAGDLVNDWKRLAEGRATVGFFPRRTHAQEAMELLKSNGIDAHYVDGETPDDERQMMFNWLMTNLHGVDDGNDILALGRSRSGRPSRIAIRRLCWVHV